MAERLENLLGVVALAAADRMRAGVEATLEHGGSHPAALVHLLAHEGDSIEDLRVALGVSQPGAVRTVTRLEDAGLLERRPGRDARCRSLRLTAAGRAAARRALGERARGARGILAALEPEEKERLLPLLERLAAGLADDRPEAIRVCRLCDRDACCGGTAECPLQHTVS
jgi:DNA-binding MarR family transcriptional regulator